MKKNKVIIINKKKISNRNLIFLVINKKGSQVNLKVQKESVKIIKLKIWINLILLKCQIKNKIPFQILIKDLFKFHKKNKKLNK
jgi:hypothetical protein